MPQKKLSVVSSSVVLTTEPLLVPLAEAARLLGVKTYSIRQLTRKGHLPVKVIGNRWLVPYAALQAFAGKAS